MIQIKYPQIKEEERIIALPAGGIGKGGRVWLKMEHVSVWLLKSSKGIFFGWDHYIASPSSSSKRAGRLGLERVLWDMISQ